MSMRPAVPANAGDSPALGPDWHISRWGPEDQRGNGNLMKPAKVLQATRLIKTGEIVSLGRPYEAKNDPARRVTEQLQPGAGRDPPTQSAQSARQEMGCSVPRGAR